MIIPNGNPAEILVGKQQVWVCAILCDPGPVVVQGEYFLPRIGSTRVLAECASLALVDVVSQVDEVIYVVFSSSITIRVEIAVGYTNLVTWSREGHSCCTYGNYCMRI